MTIGDFLVLLAVLGAYIAIMDRLASLQRMIEIMRPLNPRSPTLREAERPFAGASSGVEQIQCPGCDSWVTLYDGNKIPFHSKLGRVDSPICQQSNAIYSPRS